MTTTTTSSETSPSVPLVDMEDDVLRDGGLLLLRVVPAVSMITFHGWSKLQMLLAGAEGFPDPLGVGSVASASLAVSAEVGAAALLVLGLFTRLATIPLVSTMLVAIVMIHGGDTWASREPAVIYLTLFLAIFATGPGRFSLDALMSEV